MNKITIILPSSKMHIEHKDMAKGELVNKANQLIGDRYRILNIKNGTYIAVKNELLNN